MAIRVPINPQTRVPDGGLGYQHPADISSGTKALGNVVRAYGEEYNREQAKRQLFDVQKMLVDETNALQTDFEELKTKAPLGAAGFTDSVNNRYATRHTALVQDLRARNYSEDAINEFEARLGSIRGQYIAQAIDFQDKSQYTKVLTDTKDSVVSLSQYANKNPDAVKSAIDEFRVMLSNSGLDAIEQATIFERGTPEIIRGAREGFVEQHPELVLGLYGSAIEQKTGAPASPETQPFEMSSYLTKLAPAEGTGKNKKSSATGHFQFLDSTMVETYKKVFGNTGETNAQILAKRKDKGVMTKIAERFTTDNIAKLQEAGAPINDATVYLSHFLGVNDAIKVISAHADETIGKLVTTASIKANPTVFKKVQDAGDLLTWAGQKMGVDTPTPQIANRQTNAAVGLPITPGNIDVSQIQPVKNADGTVSTVRSISIEEDGKIILIPTVVNGKVVSDDEAVAAYHETGQHLGIFKDEASATAYAQQLHQNEAQRVNMLGDERGHTGIDVLDLATGPERMQMLERARTIMNQRSAQATAEERAAHDEYINTFYNGLADGTLGQSDLNKAYTTGKITDYDERAKAQNIIDSKKKDETDLARFGIMLHSGVKGNPYDKDQQAAVDAGFDAAVKDDRANGRETSPFLIGLNIWERTGVLPKQAGVMIRGALIGTDPAQVAGAASVASNMLEENPNAFAGVEGGEDIGKAAATYQHYVDDLGMDAQAAANKIAQLNSPEFKAKTDIDNKNREAFVKKIGDANVELLLNNQILGKRGFLENVTLGYMSSPRGKFNGSSQLAEARQTFSEIALDHYDKYNDPNAAVTYATQQMGRFYGVENGRLLKYPATKAYPKINGSREYIFDQAAEVVKETIGFDVPKEDIWLQPTTSGSSAAAFRGGKPVPYEVFYKLKKDGKETYHYIPGKVFIADVDKARRDAAIKAKEYETKIRSREHFIEHMPGMGR